MDSAFSRMPTPWSIPMKNQINLQSLAVLAFALTTNHAQAGYEQLVARTKPCVAQIEINTDEGYSSGTGFFVTPNCIINQLARGQRCAPKLGYHDNCQWHRLSSSGLSLFEQDDLAILKVDCTNAPFLEINPNDDLMEGQTILVIGNPKHFTGTVSAGLISAIRKDYGVVQISPPISLGSSGSPVMSEQGMVVGVVVGLNESGQNLNFCIPADKIRLAISSIQGKSTPPRVERLADRPPRPEIRNQEDAEAASNASYQALRDVFDPHSRSRDRLRDDPDAYLRATLVASTCSRNQGF
jgi:hypothetical protein